MLGMYTISTCGSNFDTQSKLEGPGSSSSGANALGMANTLSK